MSQAPVQRTPLAHYKVAEQLLAKLDALHVEYEFGMPEMVARGTEMLIQRAQVHATLATATVGEA